MSDRAVSDIGGLPAGHVDIHEHEPTMTERRIDAMMMLLREKPRAYWVTDENRRTIESLTPEFYEGSAYYERWVVAMRNLLIEKGVLSEDEIETRLAEVRARFQQAAGR
ncbi:MAG: nitrile hydratase subunit beta [Gammaproteobacteria bacterium]|nr:nitrile hydratase subunit beta [Gammaproteobacteria bacterium]